MNRKLAETLKTIWAQYLAGYRAFAAATAACAAVEKEAFPELEDWELAFDPDDTFDLKKAPEDFANRLVGRIVYGAAKAFAPAGGGLRIDADEYAEKHVAPLKASGAWERFDPVALWDLLEARYGGSAGAEASYRQTA